MNIFKSGFISIFFVSMLPIVEVKGGLVLAATLSLDLVASFFVCLIASSIIIPPLIMLLYPLLDKLKKTKYLNKIVISYLEKAEKSKNKILQKEIKNNTNQKKSITKHWGRGFFKYFSLFCFVAIPLPGTGVYSGCLLASVMNLDKGKAMLVIFLANIISTLFAVLAVAGIIMLF